MNTTFQNALDEERRQNPHLPYNTLFARVSRAHPGMAGMKRSAFFVNHERDAAATRARQGGAMRKVVGKACPRFTNADGLAAPFGKNLYAAMPGALRVALGVAAQDSDEDIIKTIADKGAKLDDTKVNLLYAWCCERAAAADGGKNSIAAAESVKQYFPDLYTKATSDH